MQDIFFHNKGSLSSYFEYLKANAESEITNLDPNQLLSTSESDLLDYLFEKYSRKSPVLDKGAMYILNESEVDIDVSHDFRYISFPGQPAVVKGLSITIAIPFTGNGILFNYQPSSFNLNPPRGEIKGQEVHIIYQSVEHDGKSLKREIENNVGNIEGCLTTVKKDVEDFNSSLPPFLNDVLKRRKEKVFKNQNLVKSLNIPLKRRDDAPKTYVVPEIRRSPEIKMPVATEESFVAEPELDMKVYENILSILRNMVLVMERSPSSFKNMNEEDIRQHFLVQLNAQYEGTASGETFNYKGKTDILIRYNGGNIFIAECKFWKGEKALLSTIEQLLGYTSWRDTKTAIMIFNRNKNLSNVLSKIPETVKSHICYKRVINSGQETEFRYIFHIPQDKNREIHLTIMVFDVPG